MRLDVSPLGRQVIILALLAVSCSGKQDEIPVVPPATSPLSQPVIGFGVINVSYTHVSGSPVEENVSPGYLRQGSLVRVLERRIVKTAGGSESWVLVEGNYRGWLREALVDIYDNEGRAKTAAESLSR